MCFMVNLVNFKSLEFKYDNTIQYLSLFYSPNFIYYGTIIENEKKIKKEIIEREKERRVTFVLYFLRSWYITKQLDGMTTVQITGSHERTEYWRTWQLTIKTSNNTMYSHSNE